MTAAPDAPGSAAAQGRSNLRLVVLMGALAAMGPLAIDMYLPGMPAMGVTLHASVAETEATVSAFLAGMAIGQLIYGPASDRLGRRGPLLVGVALYTLAGIACAAASSPHLLIGARFLQAIGASAGGVVGRAVVRDRFDHTQTARMLSMLSLVVGLAPILAPLLGGLCLTLGGWRLNFWAMAAFGVAIGVTAYAVMEDTLAPAARSHARSENPALAYLALLRQRRLAGYLLAGGLNGATLFTYISAAPALLIRTYHIPAAEFGWVFGVNACGLVAGGQVNRLMLRRRTPDQVLAKAGFVAVGFGALLCLAAYTGIGGALSVLPLLFCVITIYPFMQGNTMAGALSVDALRAGSTSALAGFASFGVGAVVSGATAIFADGTARPMATAMLAALTASSLSLRFLALRRTA
ncbi:MAG: multidrug effflux MFS transporter [Caulobacteraceae bacterium]